MSKSNDQATDFQHIGTAIYKGNRPTVYLVESIAADGEITRLHVPRNVAIDGRRLKDHLARAEVSVRVVQTVKPSDFREEERMVFSIYPAGWQSDSHRYIAPGRPIKKTPKTYLAACEDDAFAAANGNKRSHERWRSIVTEACSRSRYMTFAIATAFAAPLLRFARRPEGAVFCFTGDTSTGKSSLCLVASSLYSHRDENRFCSWLATPRHIAEQAEMFNDQPFVIEDTSTTDEQQKNVAKALNVIGRMIADGRSKMVSSVVADQRLPNLRWNVLCLSSGEKSIGEIFKAARLEREGGHKTRFAAIPVPEANRGGIFDLAPDEAQEQIEIIDKLKRDPKLLGPIEQWASWMEDNYDRLPKLVRRHQREFIASCEPLAPAERRIIEKIGILAAGIKLSAKAGVGTWADVSEATNMVRYLAMKKVIEPDRKQADTSPLVDDLRRFAETNDHATLFRPDLFVEARPFRRTNCVFLKPGCDELPEVKELLAIAAEKQAMVYSKKQTAITTMSAEMGNPQILAVGAKRRHRHPCINVDRFFADSLQTKPLKRSLGAHPINITVAEAARRFRRFLSNRQLAS